MQRAGDTPGDYKKIVASQMKVINLRLNQHSVEKFFGSVVQWIVFQIPILKMQVRFLPELLSFILTLKFSGILLKNSWWVINQQFDY
jgi:hypothetical protein